MAHLRYIAMPEVAYVNGAPVPLSRIVLLTPEEARFDLALGRIYLDGTQPPVEPNPPALLPTDVVQLVRGGLLQQVTLADLLAFIGSAEPAPTLALSETVFATGLGAGAVLATIDAPAGWAVTAETTFGGRAAVAGRDLVAATALLLPAAGTIRLRATSPDGLQSVTKVFALEVRLPVAVLLPLDPITLRIFDTISAGTELADLPALIEGETRTFVPNDGRVVLNTAQTKLVRGLSAISGGTISGTLRRTLGLVTLETAVTITVDPAVLAVATLTALLAALPTAPEGQTLALAAGAHGTLTLAGVNRTSRVTIGAQNLASNPMLAGLTVSGAGASMIDVQDLTIDTSASGKANHIGDVYLDGPHTGLRFRRLRTIGKATAYLTDASLGAAPAFRVSALGVGAGLVVEDSEFSHCGFGFQIQGAVPGIAIRRNKLHHFQKDALQVLTAFDGGTFEDNDCHTPFGSAHGINHNDMAQFATSGQTVPHRNWTIRRNTFDDRGGQGGCWTQGILLGGEAVDDEGRSAVDMSYDGFLVEDNAIRVNNGIGIAAEHIRNSTFRRNLVVRDDAALHLDDTTGGHTAVSVTPGIKVFGTVGANVVIADNLCDQLPDPNAAATFSGNVDMSRGTADFGRERLFPGLGLSALDLRSYKLPLAFPAGPTWLRDSAMVLPSVGTHEASLLDAALGTFTTATGVTLSSGASIDTTAGELVFDDTDSYNAAAFAATIPVDGFYDLKMVITASTSGSAGFVRAASQGGVLTAPITRDVDGQDFESWYGVQGEVCQRVRLAAGDFVGIRGRGTAATKLRVASCAIEPLRERLAYISGGQSNEDYFYVNSEKEFEAGLNGAMVDKLWNFRDGSTPGSAVLEINKPSSNPTFFWWTTDGQPGPCLLIWKDAVDAAIAAGEKVKRTSWNQGEGDAFYIGSSTANATNYFSALVAVWTWMRTYVPGLQIDVTPMNRRGDAPSSLAANYRAGFEKLRDYHVTYCAANPGFMTLMPEMYDQPTDGVAHSTDAGYDALVPRRVRKIAQRLGYPVTGGVDGPRLVGAVRTGTSVVFEFAHDGGTALAPATGIEGLTYIANGTEVVLSNVAVVDGTHVSATLASEPASGATELAAFGYACMIVTDYLKVLRDNQTVPLPVRHSKVTPTVNVAADTTPPGVTSAATGTVAENAAYSITLTFSEPVTVSKRSGEDTALFTLTQASAPSTTATLALPAQNFEGPADTATSGSNSYIALLRAVDAAGNATEFNHTVTVTDVNEAAPVSDLPDSWSQMVFYVEASDLSGQTMPNRVATPFDGAAKADWDMRLGSSTSASTDDPVLKPAAGANPAYLLNNGANNVQSVTAPALGRALASGQRVTMFAVLKKPTAWNAIFYLLSCGGNASTTAGLQFRKLTTGATRVASADGSSAASFDTPVVAMPVASAAGVVEFMLYVLDWDPSTRTITEYVQSINPTATATGTSAQVKTTQADTTRATTTFFAGPTGLGDDGVGLVCQGLRIGGVTSQMVSDLRDRLESRKGIEIF